MTALTKFQIQGQGGGKKGGGSSDDDTMRSFAHVRLVDAISEGEIEGLVDGNKSILVNKTPLSEVREATWQFRAGLPDDKPMNGVNTTEAYVNVGAEISQELGPITRTITAAGIDGIKLLVQLNTLYKVDNKKGGLKTTDTGWKIEMRNAGGSWKTISDFALEDEKVSSPVQFQHDLPVEGDGPWDVRLSAKYGDRDDIEQNISWTGYSTVTNGRFIHPHTAMVALALSSEHVGTSTPSRHYDIKGRKILVPNNYNPITRAYTGVWSGAFKRVWSDNPAWVFYDMVENNIFGIGAEIDASVANKWTLYTIAQYCDQLVPSGYRDDNGNMVMEPRFTFNGVITDKKEAFDALRSMTTVWRGMGFYALNQFFTTIDMPQDPAHVYGPANVVDGRFEYSSTSIKARHSVVLVRFNDPNNLFEPAIEPYVDEDLLKRFGWREKTLELTGCSSRSLAHRYGKWVTETEKRETETVTFTVGLDSIHALPGEVIAINDPRRAQVRMSGRVVSSDQVAKTIEMDQAIDAAIKGTVTLRVQGNDGQLYTFKGTIATGNRTVLNVTEGDSFSRIQVNAMFILSSNQVTFREYRIISIDEEAGNKFKITALQYDRLKYAAVEYGIEFDPLPVKLDTNKLEPPTNINIANRSYTDGGRIRNDLEISWSPSPSMSVVEYRVYVNTPTAKNVLVGKTSRSSISYSTFEAGSYTFRVVAASITGTTSKPLTAKYTVEGIRSIAVGRVVDLVNAETLVGGSNVEFRGSSVRLSWRNMMKVSSVEGIAEVDSDDSIYAHTTLEFYFGATKVRTQRVKGNTFTYTLEMNRSDASAAGFSTAQRSFSVRAYVVDKDGRTSAATTISLINNAPAAIAPNITVEENFLNIAWPISSDADVAGYLVYVKQDGTSVAGTTPTATTVANNYRFKGASLTNYWVTVAGYDSFGQNSLNYATPLQVKSGFDGMDIDPPATPTGLSLSGVLNPSTSLVDVEAVWNSSTEADFDQYQFEVNVDGIRQVLTTNENKVKFSMLQNAIIQARVRVMDTTFNWSKWSSYVTYTSPSDNIPPAVPTNLRVQPGIGMMAVDWSAVDDADLKHYEVWQSLTATPPTSSTAATFATTATSFILSDLEDRLTRYFSVRAVDHGGNKSAWTAVKSARPTDVSERILDEINNATWATELGFIISHSGAALPTSNIGKMISWNGKLYAWKNTKYVPAADFEDLTFTNLGGSLQASQVANKLITAAKIADSTLTATQIADNTIPLTKLSETLRNHISAQGVSAAADAAAAQASRLASEAAAAAAQGYKNETVSLKDTVEERSAEVTQTAGVVAAAKNTSILASGNERFQFDLDGWIMTGGRLTKLSEYRKGTVDALFVFDVNNNVHQGISVNFARASTSTVTINGTSYTVPANRPRYFVTSEGRYLRTSSGETMGLASALSAVDVEITPRTGAKIVQKNTNLAVGWWPAFGDYFSIVIWPGGTLQ